MNVAIAIGVVLIVVLVCWVTVARDISRDTGGGDAIGGLLAHWREGPDDYVYVWIGWTAICLLVFVVGVRYGNGDFLLQPAQLLNALNYVFVVPILVAAYLFLLRSIAKFPRVGERGRRSDSARLKHLRHAFIAVLTWVILLSAIQSELDRPSLASPWVSVSSCKGSGLSERCQELSGYGVAFYIMRGVDTSMALGLVASIVLAFHQRRQRFLGTKLVDKEYPGLGPTKQLVNFGSALVLVSCLGSIVTLLHGAALYLHARLIIADERLPREDVSKAIRELFFTSTWLAWLVMTLLASVLCIAIVVWLRERVLAELKEMREEEERVFALTAQQTLRSEPDEAEPMLDLYKARFDITARISKKFKKAQTWPLPAGAGLAFLVAAVSQIANMLFAALSVFDLNLKPTQAKEAALAVHALIQSMTT